LKVPANTIWGSFNLETVVPKDINQDYLFFPVTNGLFVGGLISPFKLLLDENYQGQGTLVP
jgi:hypothetical protein